MQFTHVYWTLFIFVPQQSNVFSSPKCMRWLGSQVSYRLVINKSDPFLEVGNLPTLQMVVEIATVGNHRFLWFPRNDLRIFGAEMVFCVRWLRQDRTAAGWTTRDVRIHDVLKDLVLVNGLGMSWWPKDKWPLVDLCLRQVGKWWWWWWWWGRPCPCACHVRWWCEWWRVIMLQMGLGEGGHHRTRCGYMKYCYKMLLV